VPEAWIDEDKTKVGHEIPFTRHFCKYVPQLLRLREYRAALLSAAVTGRLDIRNHGKKLEALA